MEVFNEQFPGNLAVTEKLISAIQTEGVVAFTGSGTSIPALPSWGELVGTLISNAHSDGLIDSSVADTLRAEKRDFLYVMDEIYSACGETPTKIAVCNIFNRLAAPTESHKAIISTKFNKFLTINYDTGLEMAHSSLFSSHIPNITARNSHETQEWARARNNQTLPPVLHWHGLANDSSSIILSGSDYISFYENTTKNKETLRSLFAQERCALIGFGFNDPFIIYQLNSTMQPLASTNMHFAILGVQHSDDFNCVLERRRFAQKYKLEVIFFPIIERPDGKDYSALQQLLTSLRERCPRNPATNFDSPQNVTSSPAPSEQYDSYRNNLFEIGGRKIYCEPNLWHQTATETNALEEKKITVSDIMSADYHCIISAPHEFGLTNLGTRLVRELSILGTMTIMRDAASIPNYKRKILQDRELSNFIEAKKSAIVIDNFVSIDHHRLVKELIDSFPDIRIIALQRSFSGGRIANENDFGSKFEFIKLQGLTRSDIRSIIHVLSPAWNSDVTSTVVDKVYKDLLQLCIPLTPSNVIMYATVLCKDGSFVPVSRLHIVERFVSEALQRASDAYSESFNYMNKVGVVAAFCHELFNENQMTFEISRWNNFCSKYKKENLVDFDHISLLSDLTSGRVLLRYGNIFHFRYKMFFSYFVGTQIASNPSILKDCLENDRHLELDGLVEVLCGTLSDCSDVLENIMDKLERSITAFYNKYPLKGVDIHSKVKWQITNQEDDIWKNVSAQIDEGPAGTSELDQLKTSLAAERRTDDQKISILRFFVSESSVSITSSRLRRAIESAKSANAKAKRAAIDCVVRAYMLTYEVATLFAPLIAERKYVSWNGFTYINLIEDDSEDASEEARDRMLSLVVSALPTSVAKDASDSFGSRKLGQVFLALFNDKSKPPIYQLIILSLLLRSKPAGWLDAAKEMLRSMRRDDMYLQNYLEMAINQLKLEVNTGNEVVQLKDFIASIRLRRDRNVKSLNKFQVQDAISQLSNKNFF